MDLVGMGARRGSLVRRATTGFLVVMVGILAALAVDDRRQVDPRPDLIRELAEVGIVAGAAAEISDLIPRLRRNPMIATHALRIRRYYQSNEGTLGRMQELRESLDQAVETRLGALR